ncbi:flagellar hook-associated protein FlgL [Cytobacillus sp. IB215665]|uniref:flagellar hook-associated protein FlgL n=1 Tax=Cytobacillus sp. IB215665 TaxID=3097357 RepID=UPI002A176F55|nr:flagellar hook-associated protein FlgL [Cytobacillus sp. IB215665]MDX8363821.1 flagellar hook-associated protein FlgL [Cytobacillus sp. IB215665]
MRVTQGMLANNSLRHLSNSYEKLGKLQDQLSTGKKITRPSDDPVVAMKGMYYRTNLTEVEQYKRNLSEAYMWMDNSEDAISHANNAMQRVRELVVQGNNDALSAEDKEAIANEIEQIKEDIVSVANTKVAGKYIFNGTAIDKAPVQSGSPPTANQQTDAFSIEVSQGVQLQVNVDPSNIFGQGLFDTLQAIEDNLNGNPSADLDTLLAQVDDHVDQINAERSSIGARYNRLELIEDRIGSQEVVANQILSENEDIDLERVIIDLTIQETVHRAALGVGADIIQPTLMDFLR